jgi:hypothetical protein
MATVDGIMEYLITLHLPMTNRWQTIKNQTAVFMEIILNETKIT